jgi:hypothetical protein
MTFKADKKRLKHIRKLHTMAENAMKRYCNNGYKKSDAEIMQGRCIDADSTAYETLEIAERMMNRVKV